MKLVAFSTSSSPTPRPGALLDDRSVLDLTHDACGLPALGHDLDACDLAHPFQAAARALLADRAKIDAVRAHAVLARDAVDLHAPVPKPGKIFCIGLNYKDHAEEQGAELPERPLIFSKFPSCVLAPGGTIVIPKGSTETDFEAELGVVVGRRASRVSREDAMDHVLGYCNFHDVSARDFQFADGQGTPDLYLVHYPKVYITRAPRTAPGANQDVVARASWRAVRDETLGYTQRIVRLVD